MDDILNISPPYHTNAHYNPTYQSQPNSQLSIIPKRKRVKTIPFNASPHNIDWSKSALKKINPAEILICNSQNLDVNPKKSKESAVSVNNILNRSQVSNRSVKSDDKLFDRSQDIGGLLQSSLQRLYGGNENGNPHNPAEFNPGSLFSSIKDTQNLQKKDRGGKPSRNMFKNSLSGFSNTSFDCIDLRGKDLAAPSQNPVSILQNSLQLGGNGLVKITLKDPSQLDFIKESSDKDSDQNSLSELFNINQTPNLFRGDSGVIDPNSFKRK